MLVIAVQCAPCAKVPGDADAEHELFEDGLKPDVIKALPDEILVCPGVARSIPRSPQQHGTERRMVL